MTNSRVIMHIDVNSAFLSWSAVYRLQHGDPVDLRLIPSIIGGNQATRHGICLAKSIPAKKFNIQTGEPVVDCLRKCPGLVVVPPDYYLYMKCSKAFNDILREYSDRIQVFSIDECFLDYTGMESIFGDPMEAAHTIKSRIKNELGFTVNIGISSGKLLSKIAGDFKKPDMVHTLWPDEIQEKLWPLPIRDLYMCGAATEIKLHGMGIFTIGDLARMQPEYLRHKLKSWGDLLYAYAHGIEDSPVKPGGAIPHIKGLGNGKTIHFDVDDKETAHKVILSLCETVGARLRHAGYACKLVSITIRTGELYSYSHQHRFSIATDCTNAIYEKACQLFDAAWKGEPIRALRVHVSDLCTNDFIQLSVIENTFERQHILDKAIDEIRFKYGSSSVFRSTFLQSGLAPVVSDVSEENGIIMSAIL